MPTLRELTEYHKPTSLDEALKLLRRPNVPTVPIAGGSGLVPAAPRDVEAVVDLSALNLAYIKSCEDFQAFTGLCIGATTTLQTIIEDETIRDYADGVLVKTIRDTATRNVRNAASLAGSIIDAKGNSPLLTMLLALDARLTILGDKEEEVALAKWTRPDRTLITLIALPALSNETHAAYEKVARTPADLPIVCVAARAAVINGQLNTVRLALGGIGRKPLLIERASINIEEAVQIAVDSIEPPSDYFATAEYRHEMIGVLVKRVLSTLSR